MRRYYQAITTWAVLAAALAAIFAVWSENNRSRFSRGVELVLRMEDRFDGDSMQQARQDAAVALLKKQYEEADDVLDFFDTMGLLVRRGAVDREMVWQTFYHAIHGYWQAAQPRIAEERKKDPEVWKDLAELHRQLVAIENRVHGRSASNPDSWSAADLKAFLEDEASLVENDDAAETANPPPVLHESGRTRL